jgi:SepF-like predicted cell division protein (DUF552 family)
MSSDNLREENLSMSSDNPLVSSNVSDIDSMIYSGNIVCYPIVELNKGNNKITELRTFLQRESQNS